MDKPPIDAVVFDMDGVLIDSEALWGEVREEFASEHGLVWRPEDQESIMGFNTAMWSRVMVERLGLRERLGMDEAGVAREIERRLLDKYRRNLPQRLGAVAAVRLAATRHKVALATGSSREVASHVIDAIGLGGVFLACTFGDDVAVGKPAPDIYLNVLAKIGTAPGQAVGVEDSANGIRSLRAAGMAVIAAPGPQFPLSAEVLALADARIDDMRDFTLETVARAAGRGAAQRR